MIGDDGEPIFCHYNGVLRTQSGLAERMASGQSIAGSDIYFRSTPYFETASKKYAWLNDIVTVARIASFGGGQVKKV